MKRLKLESAMRARNVLSAPADVYDAFFLRGTLPPSARASESPIAMACLRLFTLPALPPRPLLAVPFL